MLDREEKKIGGNPNMIHIFQIFGEGNSFLLFDEPTAWAKPSILINLKIKATFTKFWGLNASLSLCKSPYPSLLARKCVSAISDEG